MNLQRLKELMIVIECGSLTLAAKKMDYTLSGISRSMATLENEVGFTLLNRGKKGISPTKECEQIIPYIRELLFAADKLEQRLSLINGAEEGEISIGTAYRHFYRWLTDITSTYHNLHPGVNFKINNGTSSELAEKLENHTVDFSIMSKRDGQYRWHPICNDCMVALLPLNHELSDQAKIALKTFEKYPYIATCPGQDIDSSRLFKKYNVNPDVQFSSTDLQATYAMVDAGMGISMTNKINSITDYKGICHRYIEPIEEIEIGLACAGELSPVAEEFLNYIKDRLPSGY